jgi:hypothetical protein
MVDIWYPKKVLGRYLYPRISQKDDIHPTLGTNHCLGDDPLGFWFAKWKWVIVHS